MDQDIPVGYIPAPEGWTLHFPDPDGGPDDVARIVGWSIYSNGNATPTILAQTSPYAVTIADANQGSCFVVPPVPDSPKELTTSQDS